MQGEDAGKADLQEFIELPQLIAFRPQLCDGSDCISNDARLVDFDLLARLQHLGELSKAATETGSQGSSSASGQGPALQSPAATAV